jgi:hypothetical protein
MDQQYWHTTCSSILESSRREPLYSNRLGAFCQRIIWSCECPFVILSVFGKFYEHYLSLAAISIASFHAAHKAIRNETPCAVPNILDFMQAQTVVHSGQLLSRLRRVIREFSRLARGENGSSWNSEFGSQNRCKQPSHAWR